MFFIIFILWVIGIYFLNSKREEEEEMLVFKLIGYYILGVFNIHFSGIILPIGFLISLMLKPKQNKRVKKGAALFGLIVMILGSIL